MKLRTEYIYHIQSSGGSQIRFCKTKGISTKVRMLSTLSFIRRTVNYWVEDTSKF